MDAFIRFVIFDGALLITLFFGVTFVVALVQQYAATRRITDRMASAPLALGNVYAALGGAVTPFCSCSTVPILSGMLRAQIRFGVCFTFLLASPLVNEAVMIIMWQYFGWEYLFAFVALALALPIMLGLAAEQFRLARFLRPLPATESVAGELAGEGNSATAIPMAARLRFAARLSRQETQNILPYLGVGLLIGGLIYGFVPQDWIADLSERFGQSTLILIMAALGVPFYFNLAAIVPVAFALTEKGLGLGAMTAFLVAGAGTSLPELILLFRLFRLELLIAHVLAVLFAAVVMGHIFSYF